MMLEPLESRDLLAIVSVLALDANASEVGPDAGMFSISRDAPSPTPLTVHFSLAGSAMNGTDYSTIPLQATIGPNMVSALVPLTPLADALTEGSETAILTLVPMAGYTVGTPSSATVTIADAAGSSPTVTVAATDATASETGPDTGTYTFTRTGSLAAPLTVYFSMSGTATSAVDYATIAGQAMFAMGASTTTVTLTPLADALVEGSETAILTLMPQAGYTVGTPSSATVTISDAGSSPTVTVAATDASASEVGPDTGTYTFTRTGSTAAPPTVYYTFSGTATAGTDFTSFAQVTIPMGLNAAQLILTPLADALVEGNETAVLTLMPMAGYTVGSPSSATVTIADGLPLVSVTAVTPAAHEEGLTPATLRVSRTGGTTAPLVVALSTSGSATSGVDYTALPGSVTFQPGQSYVDVPVQPLADAVDEPVETVILSIANAGTTYLAAPGQQQAQATIDDPPRIVLDSLQPAAIDEGGTVTLTGRVWNPDGTAVTLEIAWGDGQTTTQQITPAAGGSAFSVQHVYVDDDPSVTPSDTYAITATVTDGANNSRNAQANAVVNNVAPVWDGQSPLTLTPTWLSAGSGQVTLWGRINDPGVADTFTLSIAWGDAPLPEVAPVLVVAGSFFVTHSYAEDEDVDKYVLTATITDDDGGATGQATVELDNNRAPYFVLSTGEQVPDGSQFTPSLRPDRRPGIDEATARVFRVHAADKDSPEVLTYSFSTESHPGLFRIDSSDGTIYLAAPVPAPFDQDYFVVAEVVDSGGRTDRVRVKFKIDKVSVGVAGDSHSVEGTADQIHLRFERYVLDPADMQAPLRVYFSFGPAYDNQPGNPVFAAFTIPDPNSDLDAPSQAALSHRDPTHDNDYFITIPAGASFTILDLTAIADGLIEGAEVRRLNLTIGPNDPYVLAGNVDSNSAPLAKKGIDTRYYAELMILDGITLFASRNSDNSEDPDVVDVNDVMQGSVGDCYFWAAVIALIQGNPYFLKSSIRVAAAGEPHYEVRLFHDAGGGDWQPIWIPVTLDLSRGLDMAKLSGDYRPADGAVEVWTVVLETAYATLRGGWSVIDASSSTTGAWMALTGMPATGQMFGAGTSDEQVRDAIAAAVASGRQVAVRIGSHRLVFASWVKDENGVITGMTLRNPWGGALSTQVVLLNDFSETIGSISVLEVPVGN